MDTDKNPSWDWYLCSSVSSVDNSVWVYSKPHKNEGVENHANSPEFGGIKTTTVRQMRVPSGASSTPTALCPPAQGWRRRSLPWDNDKNNSQPQRGCGLMRCVKGRNPVGVGDVCLSKPKVALADSGNLGLKDRTPLGFTFSLPNKIWPDQFSLATLAAKIKSPPVGGLADVRLGLPKHLSISSFQGSTQLSET